MFMCLAAEIGPLVIEFKAFLKRDARNLIGDAANTLGGDAATLGDSFGGVFLREITLRHQVEHRLMRSTCMTVESDKSGRHALLVKRGEFASVAVNHQVLCQPHHA